LPSIITIRRDIVLVPSESRVALVVAPISAACPFGMPPPTATKGYIFGAKSGIAYYAQFLAVCKAFC
jgi:hypothetical protein